MARSTRKIHPGTEALSPPFVGQEARPIRCDGVSADTPSAPLMQGRSATGFDEGNPVAPEYGCVSESGLTTSPAGQVEATKVKRGVLAPVLRASSVTGVSQPPPESLAARRRRIAEERDAEQAEAHRRARPEGTNALGHSAETQQRLGLEVLLTAYTLAQADWQVGAGGETPRNFVLRAAGGEISGHYALRLLGYVPERPYGHAETLVLLGEAIRMAGGVPPPLAPPKPPRRKTGPKVSAAPPSSEEVERRRALYVAALEKVRPLLVFAAALIEA